MEETVTSIGQPSIVSAHTHAQIRPSNSSRTRLVKQPPRTASPLAHTAPEPDSFFTASPSPPARKILALMKSTCGRMAGMLAFRRGETNPWSLSYCHIEAEAGSLVYTPSSTTSTTSTFTKTLIPDLRGCQVKSAYDSESYTAYIDVMVPNSSLEMHLRPPTQEEFDTWFAALLCWQPIRPKGMGNKMAKSQAPVAMERRLAESRRHSEVSLLKEAPIIKVGKMVFWDTNVSYSSNVGATSRGAARPQAFKMQSFGSRRWRRVSCTLRENGELKLYSDTDVTLVSVIQLSQLSRSAIQRLDPSVLDNDFCIAIYPQYTSTTTTSSLLRPIFLSLESRVLYEVWVVLLRAFTIPQLYGPKQPSITDELTSSQTFAASTKDMFRMERLLSVRIIEARLLQPVSPMQAAHQTTQQSHGSTNRPGSSNINHSGGGYYVEILLDGETRARTSLKDETSTLFWREDFEFPDLPAILSTASLLLRKRLPSPQSQEPPAKLHKDNRSNHNHKPELVQDPNLSSEGSDGYTGVTFDQTHGKVEIYLDDLTPGSDIERWWTLQNTYGQSIGEILLKLRTEEGVILMAKDYQPMSELLHRFSNGLTMQIAQMIPNDLKRVSECLLNIFQVSGQAGEWIMSLVEEEIDGTIKETPASRLRLSKRLGSTDSNHSVNSASDRELFLRDMGNSAKQEANLLFRGNTLLTKAVDYHMKRLGKEYLEETLCDKLKQINDKDPDCEVDPTRTSSQHELDRNWRRLISYTELIWQAISNSASRCPAELRLIFRHVRACAEDRYGDFMRTVTYSSVSGFLFLRFFCPAVLNPKLFGLLKDHPQARARRTLTLIAKSLQGLANMSTFGQKESWMEPMNTFLTSHRQDFKTFIDNICSVPSNLLHNQPILPPSYSTPLAILQRLPPTSREGFPSLPYLIDHAKNFAALVGLWLEGTKTTAENIQASDGDLLKFHTLCLALNVRTQDCLERAERAERPSSSLSVKWEELVEQLEGSTLHERSTTSASIRSDTNARNANKDDNDDDEPEGEGSQTPLQMALSTRQRTNQQHDTSSIITASTATPGSSLYEHSLDARLDDTSRPGSSGARIDASATTPWPSSSAMLPTHFHAHGSGVPSRDHTPRAPSARGEEGERNRNRDAGLWASRSREEEWEEETTALPSFREERMERTEGKEGGVLRIVGFGKRRKGEKGGR
ncbi:Rho GTPase activation protein [Patellaria atrata CBS 101060]|uniref:Rho GTPase activation protein n=1 Tax=Patellaria atrata CBS 101060 TaxID=1346257 RepID=A0A9P4SGL1_9PEZI|nr:Rho GTPase activation protein [Patellaria atrata CBS 101060]